MRLAVGLPLLAAGVLAVEFALAANAEYLPIDPGYEIERTLGEQLPGPPLELAVLGDSTVAGVGSPTAEESLPVLVAERVAGQLGRPVHVVGYGVSGARTASALREQVPRLLDSGVDVAVIVVGANDVTHLTPPGRLGQQTSELLAAASAQAQAPVVLGGIPRFRTVPALLEPLRTIVDAYARPLREAQRTAARAAGAGVTFVDIAAEASPRFLGVPRSMSSDGFHPSPVGYGFWADALAPAIAAAVRDG